MRTKSLFDYDHEGTKNNKNDIFNYTQVYLKKSTVSFKKRLFISKFEYGLKFLSIQMELLYPSRVFKQALKSQIFSTGEQLN